MNALLSNAAWAASTPIVLLVGTLLLALLEQHLPAVTPATPNGQAPEGNRAANAPEPRS